MIQRIKTLLTSLTISGLLFLPLAIVPAVHAAAGGGSAINSICTGASLSVSGSGSCDSSKTSGSINGVISFALNIFSIVVGIAAVIMITVGGLKYVLSGGDSNRVSGAKDTILFAIVGLVVVALAQIIVHFVLGSVSSKLGAGTS